MPTRTINKTILSKNIHRTCKPSRSLIHKKIDFEEIPFATVKVTMHALRWIFLIIFVYITVSIVLLIIQGGNEFITNIVVYSVTGFFTFFMGYFGWMFARSILEIMSGKQLKEDDF